VQNVCKVECTDLIDNVECDILIGNLTADILLRLLDSIKNKMKKGTKLVLSGIISERLDEVLTQYGKYGFSVIEVLSEDDWRAVSLKV
jgi:ribosomal protein L11 methyltransferase